MAITGWTGARSGNERRGLKGARTAADQPRMRPIAASATN